MYSASRACPRCSTQLVIDVDDRIGCSWSPSDELAEELAAEIRKQVRADCSPRHVPDEIVRIAEVPRTLSNKKLEVPVKRILHGADPAKAASRDSLANPAALDSFAERVAELSSSRAR